MARPFGALRVLQGDVGTALKCNNESFAAGLLGARVAYQRAFGDNAIVAVCPLCGYDDNISARKNGNIVRYTCLGGPAHVGPHSWERIMPVPRVEIGSAGATKPSAGPKYSSYSVAYSFLRRPT
jgi:hypothetical protein